MASFSPAANKGDETTVASVLLKFLRACDFRAGDSFELLCKTFCWRREPNSLGFIAGDGELLPEESLRGATDMEAGKARCIRWRVRVMEPELAELDSRTGSVPSLLQIVMNDVGQVMVYAS